MHKAYHKKLLVSTVFTNYTIYPKLSNKTVNFKMPLTIPTKEG